ncbi:piggyBac transposable element-derived protein 4-like [Macrosteles quadrilineatus]|uniref:piggyBac transposable element-derived protein 4-like n=1 Tax=Macrosteles quadrilineatus TaxID=74068 RepID=UPI0023E16E88|nr:piggyBac transposable element-derived protein 4-like [Macrosteles quadrilineatus]
MENYAGRSSDLRELLMNDLSETNDNIDSEVEPVESEESVVVPVGLGASPSVSQPCDETGDESDLDVDIYGLTPEHSLTDFSSGSEDDYVPHSSELDTSQREVTDLDVGLDVPTVGLGPPAPPPGPGGDAAARLGIPPIPNITRPIWTRVYPPEPEGEDIETKFTVRNTGIRDCPPRNSKPIAYFNLFFPYAIWMLFTTETNAYASREVTRRRLSGELRGQSRLRHWVDVTYSEMKKYIALVINMGLIGKKNLIDYWDQSFSQRVPFFPEIMSRNRFQAISSMFHLTSEPFIAKGEPGYDPWQKIRKLLDHLNDAFKRHFVPSQNLAIDESMIGMKNRTIFIQYMPNKRHARFGIKKFEICDSATGYLLHTALYSGKDFLSDGDDPFTQKVIFEMMNQTRLLGKHHHVFTDNFYTKLPLAEALLRNDTYLTGTVNKKSKDLSRAVVGTQYEAGQTVYFRKGKVLLVGYKQKKKRKPVYLITTACHAEDRNIVSRSGLQAVKPLVIHKYNLSMGGVDQKDKSIYHHSCTRPTRKYWRKIFFNLMDMAMLNAYILYSRNTDHPLSRKRFMVDIVETLVRQQPPAEPVQVNPLEHNLVQFP